MTNDAVHICKRTLARTQRRPYSCLRRSRIIPKDALRAYLQDDAQRIVKTVQELRYLRDPPGQYPVLCALSGRGILLYWVAFRRPLSCGAHWIARTGSKAYLRTGLARIRDSTWSENSATPAMPADVAISTLPFCAGWALRKKV